MIKEALDEKYSYQIDEHGMVHLFRGEEDCQQYLTNPLLSAIFKIEALKKENEDLKEQCLILADCNTCHSTCKNENVEMKKQLTKAKEIIKKFSEFVNNEVEFDPEHPQEHTDLWNELCEEAEQFISEVEDERSNAQGRLKT